MKPDGQLTERVRQSLTQASTYAFNRQHSDGHWCGEIEHDVSFTAEAVMVRIALGLDVSFHRDDIVSWLLSQQNPDGSWSCAPGLAGDVSLTVEAYFALKLLDFPSQANQMRQSRVFVQDAGGVAKVRMFTRIHLAMFGLFPWRAVPELPAEVIFCPPIGPLNVYRLAVWARFAVIPLLVVSHHRPVFALPNGRSECNDYLDELWCNPANKMVPYSESLWQLLKVDYTAAFFSLADTILSSLGGLRGFFPTRTYARRKCISWILDHQEENGDYGGVFPTTFFAIFALHLEGFALDSPPLGKAVESLERFAWHDDKGKRYQSCNGPVWDTILMTIALGEAGAPSTSLSRTVDWITEHQCLDVAGDWKVFRPSTPAGGFNFFYFTPQKPDTDDTSVAIIALMTYSEDMRGSMAVQRAAEWLLGMQNKDGGWGSFEADNNYVFWNKTPFNDMDALCDPSTSDSTGRVLEAFGTLLRLKNVPPTLPNHLVHAMETACTRAIHYLCHEQEATGAWFGRWGVNYIYGTSNVLRGLAMMDDPILVLLSPEERRLVQDSVQRSLSWLRDRQNPDGGWGETALSYGDPTLAGKVASTASQTAWALLALMAYCPVRDDTAIRRGVEHLLCTQTIEEASWPMTSWTGVGFPGVMYIGYELYSHHFPMMALARYLRAVTP
ncbi:hypothetical protein FE257_012399 [Aspergillus nanangensis]|uniref:Terpene cyclase/mutase family member n=1 Tax=Aspergillus nanangensis TaxID=2582783 RepID=A0AAD4CV23_ASPNN|nr:hypothetical protein FE257_012399 [Aspergillus nanangensis]